MNKIKEENVQKTDPKLRVWNECYILRYIYTKYNNNKTVNNNLTISYSVEQ